jgi:hypothetical protein
MGRELDAGEVDAALQFATAWVETLQLQWQQLIATAVWGDVAMASIGAAPRLRKRALELGERLRSLTAPRAWIPHPRERLKSALAAALAVQETLQSLDALLPELSPAGDAAGLRAAVEALRATVEAELPARTAAWARMLDSQVGD